MKRIGSIILFFLLLGGVASATKPGSGQRQANGRVYQYIDGIYAQLKYQRGMKKMKIETFRKSYYGYLNLLEHGKVRNSRYLTVCDFSLSSNSKRLWVIDTRTKRVVINTLVAHGQGTGEEYARRFSNIPESHQSSLGFFITRQTYSGHNGYSMRMDGVDGRWNNKAYSRDIVMHGASYVSHAYARANKRLGRSWGCPSVASNMAAPIIDKIKNGSVLFIYHPTQSYLRSSYWLNNRVGRLPKNAPQVLAATKAKPTNKEAKEPTEQNEQAAAGSQEEEAEDKSVLTVTTYEDAQEIQDLKNNPKLNVQTITIPANQITPEMKEKAIKRKKVVRKISKIIDLTKTKKKEEEVK